MIESFFETLPPVWSIPHLDEGAACLPDGEQFALYNHGGHTPKSTLASQLGNLTASD
ncbi:hypothetical protein BVIET440_110127 [Burkholderia vietnamiensis]